MRPGTAAQHQPPQQRAGKEAEGRWELPEEVGNPVNWSHNGCWKDGGRFFVAEDTKLLGMITCAVCILLKNIF